MPTPHVSEKPLLNKIVGGCRHGIEQEVLVDGDLASTIAVAKAAVVVDSDKKHVSERSHVKTRVNAALDLVDNFDSTYKSGSDADKATMLALSSGTRNGSSAPRF
jgi:hypothetical protein